MKNILGIILVCDAQNTCMYTIVVKSKYARNHFDLCPQKLLTNHGVNMVHTLILHQAVKATTSGGQRLFRCDCSGNGKKQCQTNRCKCFKAGKCAMADAIRVSHVRTSRQCM